MASVSKSAWLWVAAALALGASACQTDAYCFVCEQNGGAGGGSNVFPDGGTGGVFIPPNPEASTGDSGVDANPVGCSKDLQTDTKNCGTCGHVCDVPGAFSQCVAGQCQFKECAPGLVDLNHDLKDGCECTTTNGGVEICDTVDNNCDGQADEGFDLQTDVKNCGACNVECPDLPNATTSCSAGKCHYTCATGFTGLGQEDLVGCTYQCPVFPTTAETCDGVDQDCDGVADNGNPGAGVPCNDNCPVDANGVHNCQGVCQQGATACAGSAGVVCIGGGGATGEICDGKDNDCNGQTDEGFDLTSDPLNCGACNAPCAVGDSCVNSHCNFVCAPGTKDLDGVAGNRCEYTCPVFPIQPETCDGIDQDCDGIADNGATDVGQTCTGNCPTPDPCVGTGNCGAYAIAPNNGACYGVCSANGVTACPSGLPVCTYSNQLVDELCNGLDDNCDGRIDEGYDLQQDPENCGTCGHVCSGANTLVMTCQGGACTTIQACQPGYANNDNNPANGCEYKCPVFPPQGESCNNIDDDCDGVVDNSPSGLGQACNTDCPAPDPCIAANNCTKQKSTSVNGCYGACAADGRTACNAGSTQCTHPAQTTEACNGLDDDCDGLIDNGFDFLTDVKNCGACGVDCAVFLPGVATVSCVAGVCNGLTCKAGSKDIDGNPTNGCEYTCPVFPTKAELCNGVDDDCDGVKDDSPTDVGKACTGNCPTPNACVATNTCSPYPIAPQTGGCYGACQGGGTTVCLNGGPACQYSTVQKVETCNGIDDNCDGRIDEGFNKQTDSLNCGTCGNVCAGTHVTARICTAGVCGAITGCASGYRDVNGNPADGCEYACPVFPPTSETCNNKDDDCDGTVDNNVTGTGSSCTANCPAPNACVAAGTCTVPTSTPTNGCYGVCATDGLTTCPAGGAALTCIHPASGTEVCNALDDNCDGRIDEGFNKQTDTNNCGGCGNVCSLPNTQTVQCVTGTCRVGTCATGYNNVDGNQANGCEYKCPVAITAEVCNGVDDNCDGLIDNNATDVGTACSDNCPNKVCQGICTTGTLTCVNGAKVCQGGGGVQAETCNNKDDDCNGVVDNGFNKQTDPLNCGSCGNVCNLPNVDVHTCTTGTCGVLTCDPGFSNRNGTASDGCEYTCPVFPIRTETCNGVDDDCDGLVDGADPDLTKPSNFCVQTGPCAGSSPQCTSTGPSSATWRCNYGADVDVVAATGQISAVELRCDGKDNNCNGQADEAFPLKGQPCTVGKGLCAGTSTYACTVDQTGVQCPATATATNAVDEDCNGVDDDCDGVIDERAPVAGSQCYNGGQHACLGWIDPMVKLGTNSVWVYAYEASRTDATSSAGGVAASRSCSKGNKIPWSSLNQSEAAAACAAVKNSAGQPMRLCTTAEWETACEASLNNNNTPLWSYATSPGTYVAGTCNDNNAGTSGPWASGKTAGGADNTCYANWGGLNRVYDMSGNLSEWTSTSATVNAQTYYRVRGGNYQTFPMGTRCDFNFVLEKPTFQNFDLGFRCCSDAAP